ncbi:hypothetical protein QWJ07_32855 [Frankia sp. RB7]|nr:hypothetical protein [Frankia sp. RB7]
MSFAAPGFVLPVLLIRRAVLVPPAGIAPSLEKKLRAKFIKRLNQKFGKNWL